MVVKVRGRAHLHSTVGPLKKRWMLHRCSCDIHHRPMLVHALISKPLSFCMMGQKLYSKDKRSGRGWSRTYTSYFTKQCEASKQCVPPVAFNTLP